MPVLTEFVGVYDADGGLHGEAAYVIGHMLGRTHCALCDITHSPVRRKPEWDRMAASLPAPMRLLHRNELDDSLAQAIEGVELAVVLARIDDEWTVALTAAELDTIDGSVTAFDELLRERIGQQEWVTA